MTTTQTKISMFDAALHYAREWRWRVFPLHSITDAGACTCGNQACKSPGKHPLTKNGCSDATTDENQIKAWFGDLGTPHANIGIATGKESNLVVVDFDEAKGASYQDLYIGSVDVDALESTAFVETGNGVHFYYQYPKNAEIKNSASKLGTFIDVRGDGGYVVAPPSKHVSGKIYQFVDEKITKLLELPQEWIDKLLQPTTANQANSQPHANGNGSPPNTNGLFVPPPISNLVVPDEIKSGSRNQTLTKIGGSLRRIGLSENAIASALLIENKRVCQPPLDDAEVYKIAHSVARYKPHDDLNTVADAGDSADYENTLQPYLFGEFLEMQFEEKEKMYA